jgi:NADH-quinone oxidoreductase subunit H
MCAMTTTLFFGGWLSPFDNFVFNWIPGMDAFNEFVPGVIWFLLKTFFFFFIFSWVKASVPRYRYDQLMRLGWKVFLPVSLAAVIIVAGFLVGFDMLPNAA